MFEKKPFPRDPRLTRIDPFCSRGGFPKMIHRAISRASRFALLIFACLPLVAMSAAADDLEEVLVGFDEVQRSLRTLSADFKETTTNQLLNSPAVAHGRFFMTKPDSIRWEYVQPEEMRFVIYRDQYTGYFPARKSAEKRSVRRLSNRIFRFIGLGQASSELQKLYDIRLEESQEQIEDTYLLVFEPKKRRVRKRVETVYFTIDAESYLPVKVEYRSKSGNTRLIEFEQITLNPDLAASLYQVDIPADVEVTKGFSGLPALGDGSAQ